ncbi:transcriptional regulator, partial [Pseudomonas sp. GW247-3R2A]
DVIQAFLAAIVKELSAPTRN